MTTTELIKKLNDLADVGIVNAREDTAALKEAAGRLYNLRSLAFPKWDWWLIMDDGLFLANVNKDGETEWTDNRDDAWQFAPEERERADMIAEECYGEVVLYGDILQVVPIEFVIECVSNDEGAGQGKEGNDEQWN